MKTFRNLFIILSLFSTTAFANFPAKKLDYKFKGKISREVLENYLDRAITIQSLLIGQGDFDDNLRMIKNIGAKFIGRAV